MSELIDFELGMPSTATGMASTQDGSSCAHAAASSTSKQTARDASFQQKLVELRGQNDELYIIGLDEARVRLGSALDETDNKAKRQLAYHHNTHFQAEGGRLGTRIDGQQAAAAAALKCELTDQSKRLRRAHSLEIRQLHELSHDERVSSALRITNLQAEVGELTRQLRRT